MPIDDYFDSCDELFSRRSGTPFDLSGTRTYIRRFRVIVRVKEIGSLGVCYCPGLPVPFSPYNSGGGLEYDLAALMIGVDAEQETEDDWQNWIVTCRYSTQMPPGGQFDYGNPGGNGGGGGEGGAGSSANNPELEPPDIEWDFEETQEAIQKDLDQLPIVNSSQQAFDPPLTFPQAYATLVYSRNQLSFDRRAATDYAYALNSDNFLGAEPETAQCLPPRAKRVFRGNISYWRVTYRVRFARPKKFTILGVPLVELATWQPEVLDVGTMQTVVIAGNRLSIPIFRGGQPVPGPIMLDGTGKPAPLNADGTITPHYRKFRIYQKLPFAQLFQIKPGVIPGGFE